MFRPLPLVSLESKLLNCFVSENLLIMRHYANYCTSLLFSVVPFVTIFHEKEKDWRSASPGNKRSFDWGACRRVNDAVMARPMVNHWALCTQVLQLSSPCLNPARRGLKSKSNCKVSAPGLDLYYRSNPRGLQKYLSGNTIINRKAYLEKKSRAYRKDISRI